MELETMPRLAYYPFENETWTDGFDGDQVIDEQGDNDLTIDNVLGTVTRPAGYSGRALECFDARVYSDAAVFATGNTHWKIRMKLFSADFSQVFLQLAFRRADFGRGSYEWSLRATTR